MIFLASVENYTNSDGIRTKKETPDADYYYRLSGSKVVEMAKESENGIERFVFVYDAEGRPHELHYYVGYDDTTPTKYFYVLNLQGDVVQLRDTSNAVVANYTYDAWGRLVSVKNASGSTISDAAHIANVNPIRYRGYFYDTETKLYYCNSRYYDPQVKRFINADVLLSTGTGFLGYNMFAYCENNPVMGYDPSGAFVLTISLLSGTALALGAKVGAYVAGGVLAYKIGKYIALNNDDDEKTIEPKYYPPPASTTSDINSLRSETSSIKQKAAKQAMIERKIRNLRNASYSVYVLEDSDDQIQYVGRTTNISARETYHGLDPNRRHLSMVVLESNLSYETARGLEQAYIIHYNTLNKANPQNNQINGISLNNSNKGAYINAAKCYMGARWNMLENEVLCWMGM